MALSDQVKVPAQVKGAVGGGGGALSATDITTAVQDLQTSASPQFAAIQLGHASDTTLARSGAGVITVEGVEITTNTASQTLTNKTLTAPKLANGGFIADANGNEGLILVTTASAVNEVTLTPAATGNAPKLAASGGDTNINLQLAGKGSGGVAPQGTGGTGHFLKQNTLNGVITSEVPSATDATKLPLAGGTMSGALNFASAAAGTSSVPHRHSDGGTANLVDNVASAGLLKQTIANVLAWDLRNNSTFFTQRFYDSAAANIGSLTQSGGMVWDVPSTGLSHTWRVNASDRLTVANASVTSAVPMLLSGTQTEPASTTSSHWQGAAATHIACGLGCLVRTAKLLSRANSTAYSLCPAPAGDVLRVLLQDSSGKRAVALVDASGAVTFEAGSHADYVVGSSPASGEVGVYVTASILTIKPGSAGARSIACFVERARA